MKISMDELVAVVAAASDDRNQNVCLDREGHFRVHDRDEGVAPSSMPWCAVWSETLAAGNGYLGPEAAASALWMRLLHQMMQAAWAVYERTGEPQMTWDP